MASPIQNVAPSQIRASETPSIQTYVLMRRRSRASSARMSVPSGGLSICVAMKMRYLSMLMSGS